MTKTITTAAAEAPAAEVAAAAAAADEAEPLSEIVEPLVPITADDVQRILKRRANEGIERECLVKFVDVDAFEFISGFES